MAKLKDYQKHQKKVVPEPDKPEPSGIACTEVNCNGEMMIVNPRKKHPELPLSRAICDKCGWRGWV